MRLKVAAELVRFYQAVGRPLTALGMMQTVSAVFALQWKSIQDRKKEPAGDVPKISRTLGVVKWVSVFTDFCYTIIGVRDVPLVYVLRGMIIVPAPAPPRATDKPYSEELGSVQIELIARVSFDRACFLDDRGKLWPREIQPTHVRLEEAKSRHVRRARNSISTNDWRIRSDAEIDQSSDQTRTFLPERGTRAEQTNRNGYLFHREDYH